MNIEAIFKDFKAIDSQGEIYIYDNKIILLSQKGYVIVYNSYDMPDGIYDPIERDTLIRRVSQPRPYIIEGDDKQKIDDIIGYSLNIIDKASVPSIRVLSKSNPQRAPGDKFLVYDGQITVTTGTFISTSPITTDTVEAKTLDGIYEASNVKACVDQAFDFNKMSVMQSSLQLTGCNSFGDVVDVEIKRKVSAESFNSYMSFYDNVYRVFDERKVATVYGLNEIRNALVENSLDTYDDWLDKNPTFASIVKRDRFVFLQVGAERNCLLEMELDMDTDNGFYDIKLPLSVLAELVADATPWAKLEIPQYATMPLLVKDVNYVKAGSFTKKW